MRNNFLHFSLNKVIDSLSQLNGILQLRIVNLFASKFRPTLAILYFSFFQHLDICFFVDSTRRHMREHFITFLFGSWQVEVGFVWHLGSLKDLDPFEVEVIWNLRILGSEHFHIICPAQFFFVAVLPKVVSVAHVAKFLVTFVSKKSLRQ